MTMEVEDFIIQVAKLMEGSAVPRSLGIMGTATEPWDELHHKLNCKGWSPASDYEAAIREVLA